MKKYELLALSHSIYSLELLKWLSDIECFQSFCKSQNPSIDLKKIYPGYSFCIECCLIEFFDGLASDVKLKLDTHYSLSYAQAEAVYIEKLSLNCEKVSVLRNIYNFLKPIKKAKNFVELAIALRKFNDEVMPSFQEIYDLHFAITKPKTYSKEAVLRASLVHFLQMNFVQIGGFGPYANNVSIATNSWGSRERLKIVFSGYKQGLQYLWYKLLGSDFYNTRLVQMHQAENWNTYVYLNPENGEEHPLLQDKSFDIEKQTSLDSFFYWINYEVYPLVKDQIKLDPMSANELWRFQFKGYDKKKLFHHFLDKANLKEPFDTLSWEEKILAKLLWREFEFVEREVTGMHVGVATFNLMLAGSIELQKHGRDKEHEKVLVVKFIHPHEDNAEKRDYSYGIYVDSYATAGRNYTGWFIHSNACGDYSGFSGGEHDAAETLLKRYKKEKRVDVHELVIPLNEFTKFIAKNGRRTSQSFISERSKILEDKLAKARANLLELFVHHLCVKNLANNYKVSWSVDKQKGEIDIRITAEGYIKIIECKVNPQNVNLQNALEKIKTKLSHYSAKDKKIEFWFWKKPSEKSATFLNENNAPYIVMESRKHPWLATTDLSGLSSIMDNSYP